jgi:class 3 adenylate cyclase
MDIAAWLRELGLERYEQAFCDHAIDAELLPTLTADDLNDLGVIIVGHRRKLLNAIAALRGLPEKDGALTPAPTATPALGPQLVPKRSEAERRQLTVMFVDLVGSTALAARLDPEDIGQVLRSYQDTCTEVVERWDGHVAKYMGDGVLAYFGWPQAHEDDADRAVRAGLDLGEMVARLKADDGTPLAARTGIATGLVMVGDLVGEDEAQERAVVGDTPNLAARLQGIAAPGQVVVADTTRRLLGAGFAVVELGWQELKGLDAPVAAFAVLQERSVKSRFEARRLAGLSPLVGRTHEVALLVDRWALAREGEGQAILLSGEPGIGKSRLLEALRERLAEEPHVAVGISARHIIRRALSTR